MSRRLPKSVGGLVPEPIYVILHYPADTYDPETYEFERIERNYADGHVRYNGQFYRWYSAERLAGTLAELEATGAIISQFDSSKEHLPFIKAWEPMGEYRSGLWK